MSRTGRVFGWRARARQTADVRRAESAPGHHLQDEERQPARLERIDLALEIGPVKDTLVFFGGPVQTDRGFVLHAPAGDYSSSIKLGAMALTTSRDVLQAVADGNGPARMLVTLGYAGWGAGQLESEMGQNAWLSVGADDHIIFDVPPEDRYPAALKLLGIDPVMLAGDAGHA